MAQSNKRAVLSIYGLAGSGKTRYARKYLDEFTRAIIIDGGFDEDDFPGDRVWTFAEFHEYMLAHHDRIFRVRFNPTASEFALVCLWVKEAGDCLFLIDECDRFLQQGRIPEEFLDLVARGRHYGAHRGVSMVIISQNPMQIPIDVRRQSTSMIIFNTAEPADLDWLKKVVGDEWAARAPMLPEGHFLEWVKGEGTKEGQLGS